jgi:hypothetical protein
MKTGQAAGFEPGWEEGQEDAKRRERGKAVQAQRN